MLDDAVKRGPNAVRPSKAFVLNNPYTYVSQYQSGDDETSTGGNGSSHCDFSPFQTCSLDVNDNLLEKFAFSNLQFDWECSKNLMTLGTIGKICDQCISKYAKNNNGSNKNGINGNLKDIYLYLQQIKSKLDADISLLKCEKSLLNSPFSTTFNILEFVNPGHKLDSNYSNSFASNELTATAENLDIFNSDQEDSLPFLKLNKPSNKGELLRSSIPIETINNEIKSGDHFAINKYNAFINTFPFISDMISISIASIRLIKGDSVDENEKGLSPLVYLEPSFCDTSDCSDSNVQVDSKRRFVLRLRKEAFDRSFLDQLPMKTKLNLKLKSDDVKDSSSPSTKSFTLSNDVATNETLTKDFTFNSHSDILYLDTVNFKTILNLLPQADFEAVDAFGNSDQATTEAGGQRVLTLEISPFDIFTTAFPSFEHVEISVYLPYLPSTYSNVSFELQNTIAAKKVGAFIVSRQRMINQALKKEGIAYKMQNELCKLMRILVDAKIRVKGYHDIFAWGCLPVRAIDSPDQFIPLPAGYCYGDKEFLYNNISTLTGAANMDVASNNKKESEADKDKRNLWMQSSYFNLTGAPLFWRNSSIMEMGMNNNSTRASKDGAKSKRERNKKVDYSSLSGHNPSYSALDEDKSTAFYPIDIQNCRQGKKFTLYRHLFNLENAIRVGNTFKRDDDPLFTYYEKNIQSVWTFAEVKTFVNKYLLYPKNFYKIASFLESKSVGECVSFYYKFKYKLKLKERLLDIKMKCSNTLKKSKHDIKRHQKRDFHLIDSIYSDKISIDGIYSLMNWSVGYNYKYKTLACVNNLNYNKASTTAANNAINSLNNGNNLDWRRLYKPLLHLDNLREGYFLPKNISSIFTTQPLVIPSSFHPANPNVLTIRGSIHFNSKESVNNSSISGVSCKVDDVKIDVDNMAGGNGSLNYTNFAVCYALASLARPKIINYGQNVHYDKSTSAAFYYDHAAMSEPRGCLSLNESLESLVDDQEFKPVSSSSNMNKLPNSGGVDNNDNDYRCSIKVKKKGKDYAQKLKGKRTPAPFDISTKGSGLGKKVKQRYSGETEVQSQPPYLNSLLDMAWKLMDPIPPVTADKNISIGDKEIGTNGTLGKVEIAGRLENIFGLGRLQGKLLKVIPTETITSTEALSVEVKSEMEEYPANDTEFLQYRTFKPKNSPIILQNMKLDDPVVMDITKTEYAHETSASAAPKF